MSWAGHAHAAAAPTVFGFGDAGNFGSMGGTALNQPMVGMASTPSGHGYWLAARDGGVFSFGDAGFLGSMGGTVLNQPVVGIAPTPSGHGYWLAASDGGVFSFGDAGFLGSMGATPLNQPVVGMASTPSGHGYWLTARDGGIFAFGDAGFFGSMGATPLNQPVVGMASTPTGHGYWMTASDGGVFSFGDATFLGSMGATRLNQPVVGMASTPSGHGYWLAARDGGIFAFGNAGFFGSLGSAPQAQPVVGIASTPSGNGYWMATLGQLAGPGDLAPIVGGPLPGEGHWSPAVSVWGSPVLYSTFLQSSQGASPTAVTWLNDQILRVALYAGTDQPSGAWTNSAFVPGPLVPQLVAAFNSGFRLDASQGGWFADHRAAIPLRNGAASLVIFADGSATVGQWGRDVSLTPYVVAVRQNLNLLIDNGQISPTVSDVFGSWGATLGNTPTTWRAGLGVDRAGHLLYAGGPGLDPAALARVLVAAGAVRAMELDINPQWVLFIWYQNGNPTKLLPQMAFPADHYFTPNERDFIAVFSR
jgi:hypothetical protein